MVEQRAVWGIDIGQAGLKALKLRYAEAADQAVAVAFDYIPHPKILSQPDAIPEELIPQALETFLSRNDFDGDLLSISVPGKSSLARFVQLPPVEPGKVAEIVKFEAKQQIPFPLEEVIWDWQPLGNPDQSSGFMIDAEVGLFAMKREEVERAIQPFTDQKVEIEVIQTAPVALYNSLVYDELGFRPGNEDIGGDDYYIVLDMGCDDTTLIVSNGDKIWIRTVNIGGNNFTRALVKEMKLSFAKAEHLKCNATKAPDPRSVFQALRPVFNDYVAEIKRSIGFFTGVNRNANITKVFGVGNGFKLAGLQKYLAQNLDYEVVRQETFQGLAGDSVLNSPLFQENMLTFPVAYGLALQTLGVSQLNTTLLPPEIALARRVRKKKPWAVAAAATLMFGLSTAMAMNGAKYNVVKEGEGGRFAEAEKAVDEVRSLASSNQSAYDAQVSRFNAEKEAPHQLVEGRRDLTWLELYDSINATLPRDLPGSEIDDIRLKRAVSIHGITCERASDFAQWFEALIPEQKQLMAPKFVSNAPAGAGYVFTIDGVSWHDEKEDPSMQEFEYVFRTLIDNLAQWQLNVGGKTYDIGRLGISHPVIVNYDVNFDVPLENNPRPKQKQTGRFNAPQPSVTTGLPSNLNTPIEEIEKITETQFQIQFLWTPTPTAERVEADPLAATAEGEVPAEDSAEPTQ